MKQTDLDVKSSVEFNGLDEDHKCIFNYIDKLQGIVNKPNDHKYSVVILEGFIANFLEHVIKEEQLLLQYLPVSVVDEHTALHQTELAYLDESLHTLKCDLSAENIQIIVDNLKQEFRRHVYRYDRNIMQKVIEAKKLG